MHIKTLFQGLYKGSKYYLFLRHIIVFNLKIRCKFAITKYDLCITYTCAKGVMKLLIHHSIFTITTIEQYITFYYVCALHTYWNAFHFYYSRLFVQALRPLHINTGILKAINREKWWHEALLRTRLFKNPFHCQK